MQDDNTPKHTPGPWTVGTRADDGGPALIMNSEGWCVAESAVGLDGGFAETRANERLIAAAPELLEALRGLEGVLNKWGDPGHAGRILAARSAAQEAIAKAEGRS